MDTLPKTATALPPAIAAALARHWEHYLPEIQDRLAVLDSAAAATAAGTLTPEQQKAAHAAAHKLAGALGMFGLSEATDPARETELLYATDTPPSRESAPRLILMASKLRALVENHKHQAQ